MGGLFRMSIVNNVDNDRKLGAHISEGGGEGEGDDYRGARRELER